MRERAYNFGDDVRLVGVLTQPSSDAHPSDRPAVLLLNAGLLHRVGPARLNVDLSRRLAGDGFTCLRFDLSGLGDSDARRDRRSEGERAVDDIRLAMDFLQSKLALQRFVLVGLCSGADNAHLAAIGDRRVVGMVLLDPYGYKTAGYYVRHYGPRLAQPGPWLRFAHRTLLNRAHGLARTLGLEPQEGPEMFERTFGPRAQVAAELNRLVDRGVQQLLIYSGGVREHYYNYRDQFYDMFPRLEGAKQIEVEYYPHADHVYTLNADRLQLMERIQTWLQHCCQQRLET